MYRDILLYTNIHYPNINKKISNIKYPIISNMKIRYLTRCGCMATSYSTLQPITLSRFKIWNVKIVLWLKNNNTDSDDFFKGSDKRCRAASRLSLSLQVWFSLIYLGLAQSVRFVYIFIIINNKWVVLLALPTVAQCRWLPSLLVQQRQCVSRYVMAT